MVLSAEQKAAAKAALSGVVPPAPAPPKEKPKAKAPAPSRAPKSKTSAPASSSKRKATTPGPSQTKGKKPRPDSSSTSSDFEEICLGKAIRPCLTEDRRDYLEKYGDEKLEASMARSYSRMILGSAYLFDYKERAEKKFAEMEGALADSSKKLKDSQLQVSSCGAKVSKLEDKVKRLKEEKEEAKARAKEAEARVAEEVSHREEEIGAKAVEVYKASIQYVTDLQEDLLELRNEVLSTCAGALRAQKMEEAAAVVAGVYNTVPTSSQVQNAVSPTLADDGVEEEALGEEGISQPPQGAQVDPHAETEPKEQTTNSEQAERPGQVDPTTTDV